MINLLESVLQTFKTTKRLLLARNKQSLIHDLDVLTIKQLVLVLKPVKHVVTVVQTGNSPSLHLVLLCNLTLKRALSSYESLLDYVNTYCNQNDKPSNKWEHEENENYESEGIKWFRERLLLLIDELFNLDVRHYCATMLHPKYKLLKSCTIEERSQCHQYIPDALFTYFEDDQPPNTSTGGGEDYEYDSDEYGSNTNQFDELDQYLIMKIDKSLITYNPLDFWRYHAKQFPLLSKLAKRIYSISATSCNVEHQFSSAGLIEKLETERKVEATVFLNYYIIYYSFEFYVKLCFILI
ncbi:unnamed protein product [Rotaria sp. Silwood1]|nr:unnamed protein product [Rotaria sp. Silwood1]